MVSCHEEALNYKFKHERANKSLRNADQWLSGSSTQIKFKMDSGVGSQPTKLPTFFHTIEVDIESTNRAYIASIRYSTWCLP